MDTLYYSLAAGALIALVAYLCLPDEQTVTQTTGTRRIVRVRVTRTTTKPKQPG